MKKDKTRVILIFVITLLVALIVGMVILIICVGKSPKESSDEGKKATSSPETTAESEETATPGVTSTPSATAEATVSATAKTTVKPEKKEKSAAGRYKVAIDAGHQREGDSATEPVGPGSGTKKAKVSSGTTGVSSGVAEYQLNLNVAKKLQAELKRRGYEVCMTRTKNNVRISNRERAIAANDSGADICIRIHADGIDNSSARGASALYPSSSNPYVGNLSRASQKLSKKILDAYCKATGFKNRGIVQRDDLTGTNWSEIPVSLIEIGFMSNPSEDETMQIPSVQEKMARGIADGIDSYFGI